MKRFLGLVLGLLLLSENGYTSPIQFVYTGTGTGNIGATAFTNAAFTITANGDTASRQSSGGAFYIDHVRAWISITGVGTSRFTTGTRTFVNGSVLGFSRAGSGGEDLYDFFNVPSASTWDMLTSFGPVNSVGTLLQWTFVPVQTNLGTLVFNNETVDGTFQAQLRPDLCIGSGPDCGGLVTSRGSGLVESSRVPEPSTFPLLCFGLTGFLLRRRNA